MIKINPGNTEKPGDLEGLWEWRGKKVVMCDPDLDVSSGVLIGVAFDRLKGVLKVVLGSHFPPEYPGDDMDSRKITATREVVFLDRSDIFTKVI